MYVSVHINIEWRCTQVAVVILLPCAHVQGVIGLVVIVIVSPKLPYLET